MSQIILMYVFLLLSACRVQGIDYRDIKPIKESCKYVEYPYCEITIFQDTSGVWFLIKQIKFADDFARLARCVCEMVALDIGHSISVSLNQASLIPAAITYIGKDLGSPATLHTYVPGVRFDLYQGKIYKGLNLRQNGKEKVLGLTREIIYHMSRHKNLPALVALDTFVGNAGRGRSNYFYDEAADIFYGIDMASSFNQDLCASSFQNVQHFLDDSVAFTDAELQGLKSYTAALVQLVNLYTPDVLCNKFDEYTALAGFLDNPFFNKDVQLSCLHYIARAKHIARNSYENTNKLIQLLKVLLANQV
ncbi:MAG: hypothetical protein AB7F19_03040 [Candidatus Babeliales bacterium]